MTQTERHLAKILTAAGLTLCLLLGREQAESSISHRSRALGASLLFAEGEDLPILYDRDDSSVRAALRLQHRLRRLGIPAPLDHTVAVVRKRRTLLRTSVQIHAVDEQGTVISSWTDGPQAHPLWVQLSTEGGVVHVDISEPSIQDALTVDATLKAIAPMDARISEIRRIDGVEKAVTDRPAKPGYIVDMDRASALIAQAMRANAPDVHIPLSRQQGAIANASGIDLGQLLLLGSGQSNFKGSPAGRGANVRKALREHVSNTLVAPGERYSFNASIGPSVSLSRGWHQAKVITGGELKLEPGGGICQASTTVFRAMLHAGFPAEQWKNHSMYISYYEEGGVGLDATIYIDEQDLTFVNDTPHYLLIQAYDEGNDAFVHIYGTPDGRIASVEGPYFANHAAPAFSTLATLRTNDVGWLQSITFADGTVESLPYVSHYRALPRSIVAKYALKTSLPAKIVALANTTEPQ